MEIISKNTAPTLTDAAICANIAQARCETDEAACGDAGPHVVFQSAAAAYRRRQRKRSTNLGRFGRKCASTPSTSAKQAVLCTPATQFSQRQTHHQHVVTGLIHAADHAAFASPSAMVRLAAGH